MKSSFPPLKKKMD